LPAIEFIDALTDKKVKAALLADLSLLVAEGPYLPFPLTSGIAAHKGLRELRTRFAGTQIRTIYTVNAGRALILHVFVKTASSQVRREYLVAANRLRSLKP
jgi:hypothetical protein